MAVWDVVTIVVEVWDDPSGLCVLEISDRVPSKPDSVLPIWLASVGELLGHDQITASRCVV